MVAFVFVFTGTLPRVTKTAFVRRREKELRRTPELRSGRDEFDADASFAVDAPAHVDDAAFLFGLIAHVGQEQTLAAHDDCLKRERAALLVCLNGFGFFVEWLFVGVRAVDEQGNVVRVAQAFTTVGVRLRGIVRAIRSRRTILRAGPLSFGVFQRIPDAAQRSLPSNCRAFTIGTRWPTIAFGARRE
jgi:hypothetical protein